MGLASFWSNLTGPRIREITPRKNGQRAQDGRPATSSGVRTVRKTPSLEEDVERDLNLAESLLTTNIIEPPTQGQMALEQKKARRRSRGLSLSRSKNEDGVKRRRSLFGGNKNGAADKEDVPQVPRLPTLSAIYSAQAPHRLNDIDRPSTAISAFGRPPSSRANENSSSLQPTAASRSPERQQPLTNTVGEVFELPAELPAPITPAKTERSSKLDAERRKSRRRSLGEVLSGKARGSEAGKRLGEPTAPPVPSLLLGGPAEPEGKAAKNETSRSRKNSNASVASKASKTSRKSRRKSWWRRERSQGEDEAVPPMPTAVNTQIKEVPVRASTTRKTPSPADVDLSAFPTVPASKKFQEDDDAASIRTTRSQKDIARPTTTTTITTTTKPQRSKSKKQRPQSTASHTRRRRRSWWTSSNPDDSDDDPSNPLPPVPLLIRSATTTPESSPTNSNAAPTSPSYTAVRGENILAPRPLSTLSSRSGGSRSTYAPRSAAKSFLVSTTPISPGIRHSVRHSLHNCQDLDAGFENDRGTYCLSAEQQREWEKLKHLMAVMDRRRDVTRTTFGEASVDDEVFGAQRRRNEGGDDEEREGVKYSNFDALAALEVGVAK